MGQRHGRAGPDVEVTENGIQTEKCTGVKFLRHENGYAVYEIGSGKYEFQSGSEDDRVE